LDTDDDAADARLEEAGAAPGVEELAAKAGEYLALAQRTRADFENFRKRASRDAALAQERGLAKLAKELLPAIDNLGRALQAAAAEAAGVAQAGGRTEEAAVSGHLVEGVKLVQADLLAAFARVGIEPYSPEGEVFDPQLHEAVAQAPVEGAVSGTVVEVYQQGYRLGETVLRPARVLVAA
jgi:molecular chaperone GrpE